jgi:4-diphosphocytidyl-2-C-methyl-D-erythritol kinase
MRLWNVAPDEAALKRLALSLGADVPVCLDPRPALMCGIGERITRFTQFPGFGLLLVNPMKSLSTASVFRALAAPAIDAAQPDASLPHFTSLDDLLAWAREEPNDLEAPATAILPEISTVLSSIAATKECRLARMSGSGATCFGIYGSIGQAEAAARALSVARPGWWVKAASVSGVSDFG